MSVESQAGHVVVEDRKAAEVAESSGVSRSWRYELLARYRAEGDEALEPRSRRPKTVPNATSAATVELIWMLRRKLLAAGLDAGPDTSSFQSLDRAALRHQVDENRVLF